MRGLTSVKKLSYSCHRPSKCRVTIRQHLSIRDMIIRQQAFLAFLTRVKK